MTILKYTGDDIYTVFRKSIEARNTSALLDVKLQLRIETELMPVRRLLLALFEVEFQKRQKRQCCSASRE